MSEPVQQLTIYEKVCWFSQVRSLDFWRVASWMRYEKSHSTIGKFGGTILYTRTSQLPHED